MTRPDAALAWVIAAGVLGWQAARDRERRIAFVAYLLPLAVVYAPYFGARWLYYGEFLPNTFHAKAGAGAYWSVGFAYVNQLAGRYFLAPFVLVLLLRGLLGLFRRERMDPRHLVLLLYVAQHALYVARGGGDFMEARLLVPALPLFYLLVESSLRGSWLPRPVTVGVLAALVAASGANANRIKPGTIEGGIADERTWEPTFDLWSREGAALAKHLPRGTVVATDAIGAFGWASDLPIIDTLGLTDVYVARLPIERRGRPGHERKAPIEYLRTRGVAVLRDGLGNYRLPTPPLGSHAGNRYHLLSDEPGVRAGLSAALSDLAR
jgi:hypothetical protein